MSDRPQNEEQPASLGAMTSDEAADAGPATLLVPVGATEQHGPHLPLHTDTIIAEAWALGVAASMNEAGHRTVVAPALAYGSSGEHQMFPGTLSIGAEALRLVIIELTRSASRSFERVVYLSGHAGNLEPLTDAADQLVAEGHRVHHLVPSWSASQGWSVDAHAGRTETSLLLHLRPAEVRHDRMAPGDTRPLRDIMATMRSAGVGAVAANGILGDPTQADRDEGRDLLVDLVARTVSHLLTDKAEGDGQYDSDDAH